MTMYGMTLVISYLLYTIVFMTSAYFLLCRRIELMPALIWPASFAWDGIYLWIWMYSPIADHYQYLGYFFWLWPVISGPVFIYLLLSAQNTTIRSPWPFAIVFMFFLFVNIILFSTYNPVDANILSGSLYVIGLSLLEHWRLCKWLDPASRVQKTYIIMRAIPPNLTLALGCIFAEAGTIAIAAVIVMIFLETALILRAVHRWRLGGAKIHQELTDSFDQVAPRRRRR